jgi:hypothetical protein
MPTFLSILAEKIANNNEIPFEQTLVVVPNKRATRELLRELASHFSKPIFAPNILSVNEFIESLSPLQIIENEELLIRLFDVYKKKNTEKSDDFPAFLKWAPLFLHDLNEIDMHLTDAKLVFSNLSEIKTLETSFGKEILTEMQRKYLDFYCQLADLYTDFTSSLRAENLGYEGMIYRDAASHLLCHSELREESRETSYYARFIFAGINATTPSELEILKYFYEQKNTEIYFDIDHFYDEKYGAFIEEIQQKLRISEIPKSNDYKLISKQISFTGAPKRTAQVYQVIEILNTIEQIQGNLNDTVLVFADEAMLLPFVHAYSFEKANITMGYPLSATFAAQKLQQLIDDEKQSNRLQKSNFDVKTQGIDFLQFLKAKFSFSENENISPDHDTQLIASIIEHTSALMMKFFAGATILDFAIVEFFLQEKINATSIPFSGSVQEGLQIMGLLETRTLDFKNVLILSMNEGVLPKGKAAPSLLLYDIKRHFGLPTHQRSDAIFGYHFFRLLQRAENVFLIYDNESTNNLAEKSRFLEQLEFEVKKQNLQETICISQAQFANPFSFPESETKISIEKTAPILEKLANYNYSPTSLINYIQCPLHFYWRYIEKITAPKKFDESNESAIIGTVIHNILEEIFVQLKEKSIQFSSILNYYKENIDNVVKCFLLKQPELQRENIYEGKLYLAYQIIKKSISDYIEVVHNEWKSSIYQIIGTEVPLVANVSVGEYKLCFAGKADRIEMRDNKVTILDYKTGKVEDTNLNCKAIKFEDIFTDPKYAQLFQLLCYAYLYQNNKSQNLVQTTDIQCGIIAFKELYKQNEEYIYYAAIEKEKILSFGILQMFEEQLKKLFLSMINKETAFCQTGEVENCKYCDYKAICNR